MTFTLAVEGPSDEAVLRKVVSEAGAHVSQVYGRNGKDKLLQNLAGFNHAATFFPWIVLVDLDRSTCPVVARMEWLPNPAAYMCLRIAVRELEAWLLADADRFASYFGVSRAIIPNNPDDLADPKQELINLVRRTRRKAIREDIVPDQRLGQSIGPAYTARIVDFVTRQDGWRVASAITHSPSLRRAFADIQLRNAAGNTSPV